MYCFFDIAFIYLYSPFNYDIDQRTVHLKTSEHGFNNQTTNQIKSKFY